MIRKHSKLGLGKHRSKDVRSNERRDEAIPWGENSTRVLKDEGYASSGELFTRQQICPRHGNGFGGALLEQKKML
jgi:hypothetical protein